MSRKSLAFAQKQSRTLGHGPQLQEMDQLRRAKCQSELQLVDGKAALHTHCTYEGALTEKALEWYTCRLCGDLN